MEYEGLVDALLAAIPEIVPVFRSLSSRWGQEYLPHVVFGDVVTEHFLIPHLEVTDRDDELLQRTFDFLETMATSADVRVREVLEVTICERLKDRTEWIDAAKPFMRQHTLSLCS